MVTNSREVFAGVALVFLFLFSMLAVPNVAAQQPLNFTPLDNFSIPESNGNIRFAVNGNYTSATLENGAWTFINLKMNGSAVIQTLRVSAENSDVVIQYYRKSNPNVTSITERFRYKAIGAGVQTIKINDGVQKTQFGVADWNVGVPGNSFAPQGKIWSITSDGAIQVKGQSGNISITHYGFMTFLQNPNVPFYEAHSVVIGVLALVAVTVAVAVIIKVRNSPKQVKSEAP